MLGRVLPGIRGVRLTVLPVDARAAAQQRQRLAAIGAWPADRDRP